MKILLAAVNAKYIHSNLAVYSLRQFARVHGYQTDLVEYTMNQQFDEILRSLFRLAPDVLCFSCYIWNVSIIRRLTAEISKILPDTLIWLGGPEASYNAVEILQTWKGVTGVMRGEGEETYLELVRSYMEGTPELSAIRGISVILDGGMLETPDREPVDLSTVPFPYEDVDDFEHRIIYYESSRGCPFSCSYCLSSVEKKLRFRRADLVERELDFFLAHRVPQVKFVDRTFNCVSARSRRIWRYLLEHDNGVTNFHFEISADLLEEEDFRILGAMRPCLVQLEIGVQSTNQKTLREIRRTMNFDRLCDAVRRIAAGRNIHQHLDLIAGLPWEGYDSFARSFNDVYALHPDQLQLGFLKVLKGSRMWELHGDYGLVYQDREPYEVLYTRWLSYAEVIRLGQIEEMVEVYYNSGQFRYTLRWLEQQFSDPFTLYETLGDYYDEKGLLEGARSRQERYEILLAFMQEQHAPSGRFPGEEFMRELLTFDYYLRENAKSRPRFAPPSGNSITRDCAVYETLPANALAHYEGYDARQIRRMTHLEYFRFDVTGDGGENHGRGVPPERPCVVIFDYMRRDPVTREAHCLVLR